MVRKDLELYELVLLFKVTTVEDVTRRIDFYTNFLKKRKTAVMVKNEGEKSLTYPIKGFDTATSVQIVYLGNDTLVRQVNTEVLRDEFILRGLTTKLIDKSITSLFD
jgi:ribosomal protein S6|tara:strand:+ start:148 stop:468 length:321 start_codon:yes stop_codon:yes gene_type:complete